MKRSVKKHSKRCNGKLIIKERNNKFGLYKCDKCSFETRSYKRRLKATS